MRVAALLLLACCACGPGGAPGPVDTLASAQALLQRERYREAMAKAESGFRATASPRDAQLHARFRLLRAEILLELREAAKAGVVLREAPPPEQWPELHARYLLLAAHAQYRLEHYSEAQTLLDQAQRLAELSRDK